MSQAMFLQILHWAEVILCIVMSLNGGALLIGLVGKLPTLTGKAFDWLESQTSHIKNQLVQGLVQRAVDLVKQVVLQFENTEVESLKERVASGAIKPEDLPGLLRELKANAVAAVKAHMNAQGLTKDLLEVVFGNKEDAMTKWIEDTVEAIVAQLAPSGLQTPKFPGLPSAVQQAASNPPVAAPK